MFALGREGFLFDPSREARGDGAPDDAESLVSQSRNALRNCGAPSGAPSAAFSGVGPRFRGVRAGLRFVSGAVPQHTLKYVIGRTPAQMESIVGLALGTKLAGGAEIFTIKPPPAESEFDLKGYTQTPAGISTSDPNYVAHPGYPPGEGVPQWDLARVRQSRLVHLASVPAGKRLQLTKLP